MITEKRTTIMPTKEEMKKFAMAIEQRVVNSPRFNYIDAIVEHCTETGMEIEVAASLINSNLKSKLELNASDLNLLKVKRSRLPI